MVSKFSMRDLYEGKYPYFLAELHYMMQEIYRVGHSWEEGELYKDEQPDYAKFMQMEIYTAHAYPTDGKANLYPATPDKAWATEFTPA